MSSELLCPVSYVQRLMSSGLCPMRCEDVTRGPLLSHMQHDMIVHLYDGLDILSYLFVLCKVLCNCDNSNCSRQLASFLQVSGILNYQNIVCRYGYCNCTLYVYNTLSFILITCECSISSLNIHNFTYLSINAATLLNYLKYLAF